MGNLSTDTLKSLQRVLKCVYFESLFKLLTFIKFLCLSFNRLKLFNWIFLCTFASD